MWKRFSDRAKEFMPERGELAAHAILSEMIAQGSDPNEHTLIISEIPIEMWAKVENTCRTVLHLTGTQAIGRLIRAIAEEGFVGVPTTNPAQPVDKGAQEAGPTADGSAPFTRRVSQGPNGNRGG